MALLISDSISSEVWDYVGPVLETLFKEWRIVLGAPNMFVKICAMKILSMMLQEFTVSSIGSRFTSAPTFLVQKIIGGLPIQRLRALAETRLRFERNAFPIVSEYLQVN